MDGVEGQEHVQDAGQLVGLLELVVGAAGEPGKWNYSDNCVCSSMFELL